MARRRSSNIFWQEGTTTGVGFFVPWVPFPGVPTPGGPEIAALGSWFNHRETCVLMATSNREVWSYAVHLAYHREDERHWNHNTPYSYAPRGQGLLELTKDRLLLPEVAHLLAWAKKDIARRCKLPPGDPDALVPGVAYETPALQVEDDQVYPVPGMEGHPAYGSVAYRGIGSRIYSRTRDDLHRLVVSAIEAGSAAWGTWRPTGLEVQLHDGAGALGLAYAVGEGAYRGKTKISLNKVLFREYDDNAIWRVIVHELCHHCNYEKYPRIPVPPEWDAVWKAYRQQRAAEKSYHEERGFSKSARMVEKNLANIDMHPPEFVYLLSKADPKVTVADFNKGIWFVEQIDTALVSEISAKRDARAARKSEALGRVVYSPAVGRLVAITRKLKKYSVSYLDWVPLERGAFAKVRFSLNDVVGFAKLIVTTAYPGTEDPPHLGVVEVLSATKIMYDISFRDLYGERPPDLFQLLRYLVEKPHALGSWYGGDEAKALARRYVTGQG